MIGYITGSVFTKEDQTITVLANGVGYSVFVSEKFQQSVSENQNVNLYIYTNLRENALELFGFESLWEKRVFLLLTSVSGIGPKTALNILSGIDPQIILEAIIHENKSVLTSISGIGKKTAERLIVEISDKAKILLYEEAHKKQNNGTSVKQKANVSIPKQGASAFDASFVEAKEALLSLGYRESDILSTLHTLIQNNKDATTQNTEALVKASLRALSIQKFKS
jgi:Holliday junction DNA helicase RuvA